VTFFCLIESESPSATHMEVLDASSPLAAQQEAMALVSHRLHAVSAQVFTADAVIATLYPAGRAAA